MFLSACQESIREHAAREAREMNDKKCPMTLDPDGVVILEHIDFDIQTLVWNQEFLLDIAEGQPIDNNQVKTELLNELKNKPAYKPYMDEGFIFQYVYRRKSNPNDTVIFLSLTPSDYR